MTRYQALRRIGCDPLSAGFIAGMNWLRGVSPNRIVFFTVEIEIDGVTPTRGGKHAG